MSYSIYLLAATCLPGQVPATPTETTPAAHAVPVIRTVYEEPAPRPGFFRSAIQRVSFGSKAEADCTTCNTGCSDPCCPPRRGLLKRLFCRLGMMFGSGCDQPCMECDVACDCGWSLRCRLRRLFHRNCCDCQCVIVEKAEPALAPAPPPAPPKPMPAPTPVKTVSLTPARPSTTEINKDYLDKLANAADYSWVTGQLFYIHAGGQGIWVVRYAPVDREDRYGGSVVLAPVASMANVQEGDLVTVHGDMLNEGRATKYLGGPLYRSLSIEMKMRK